MGTDSRKAASESRRMVQGGEGAVSEYLPERPAEPHCAVSSDGCAR